MESKPSSGARGQALASSCRDQNVPEQIIKPHMQTLNNLSWASSQDMIRANPHLLFPITRGSRLTRSVDFESRLSHSPDEFNGCWAVDILIEGLDSIRNRILKKFYSPSHMLMMIRKYLFDGVTGKRRGSPDDAGSDGLILRNESKSTAISGADLLSFRKIRPSGTASSGDPLRFPVSPSNKYFRIIMSM